jgi:dTDP-4-amino-4,6-dideoxygalactose transaminase
MTTIAAELPSPDLTLVSSSFTSSSISPPFPLRLLPRHAHLFYMARAGIHHAIQHLIAARLRRSRRPRVLMPAYHHGVEVQSVRAAGAALEFYRVDSHRRIDLTDIERRLRRNRGAVAVLYVTHDPTFAQPIHDAATLAHRYNAHLFEDCALALFSRDPAGRPLGTTGDAAVWCLYKTLPVPHGGLLSAPTLPPPPQLRRPPLGSTLHHIASSFLAPYDLRFLRGHITPAAQTGTGRLVPTDLTLGPSRLLPPLLQHVDADAIVARRRRNHQRIAAALSVDAPLSPHACPLFFPIRVPDKPRLHAALHSHGVRSVDFWSSGDPACDLSKFPEVADLRRHLLELPCHQSLTDEDIDQLLHVVRQSW